MTHIAFQERLDGKAVDWLEKVTDEQYKMNSITSSARAFASKQRAKIGRATVSAAPAPALFQGWN
jgi:hypothetical protein